MVQIDVALSAAVGATLALSARRALRSQPSAINPYLAWSLVFQAAVVVPAVLFFLVGWPGWDTMYWYDADTLPPWLVPLTALLCLSAGALGFLAAQAAIRRGKDAVALGIAAAFNVPALAVIALWHERFLHVGSLQTFRNGAEPNLLSSELAPALAVIIGGYIGVPLAILLWRWNSAATSPRS